MEILLAHNNKKLIVHTNRLKVYNTGQLQDFEFPDFNLQDRPLQGAKKKSVETKQESEQEENFSNEFYDWQDHLATAPLPPSHSHTRAPYTPSRAQAAYDNLPPQSERPSNILVRLGPPPASTFQTGGGVQVQEIKQALSLADAIDGNDDDDETGWIVVTKRKKKRPGLTTGWTSAQKRNMNATGDVLLGPPSLKGSQLTHEEEDGNIPAAAQQPQIGVQPAVQPQPVVQQPGQGAAPPQGHQPAPGAAPAGPQPTPRQNRGVPGQQQQQVPVVPQGARRADQDDPASGHARRVGTSLTPGPTRGAVEPGVLPGASGDSGQPGQHEHPGQPRFRSRETDQPRVPAYQS